MAFPGGGQVSPTWMVMSQLVTQRPISLKPVKLLKGRNPSIWEPVSRSEGIKSLSTISMQASDALGNASIVSFMDGTIPITPNSVKRFRRQKIDSSQMESTIRPGLRI